MWTVLKKLKKIKCSYLRITAYCPCELFLTQFRGGHYCLESTFFQRQHDRSKQITSQNQMEERHNKKFNDTRQLLCEVSCTFKFSFWSAKEKKGTPERISSLYLFVSFVQLKLCSKWIKSVYNVLYKRSESDLNMFWKGQYHQEFWNASWKPILWCC